MSQSIDTDALCSANDMLTLADFPLDDGAPFQADDWAPTAFHDTDVLQRASNTVMLPNDLSSDRAIQSDGWTQTGTPITHTKQNLDVLPTLPNLLSSTEDLIRPAEWPQPAFSPTETMLADANSTPTSSSQFTDDQGVDGIGVQSKMQLSSNSEVLRGLETHLRRLNSCASSTTTPQEARSAFDTVLWHLVQREQLTSFDQLCLWHLRNRISD